MSLTTGLDVARSGLAATSAQIALLSRNIARAGDPDTVRKIAQVVTVDGGVTLSGINRAASPTLLEALLSATSDTQAQQVMVDALGKLDQSLNDPSLETSPSALIGKLGDALQMFTADPSSAAAAQATITAASRLATELNSASAVVESVRKDANDQIAASVASLNDLLTQFQDVNTHIVINTRSGVDVTDQLDVRDGLLKKISEEIGVRALVRSDNDMVLYTDSGITLFETTARSITFDASAALTTGASGATVYIDGVPAAGGNEAMALASGRIRGLVTVRDDIAVQYQAQLDEIARGLIEAFAESDQSASSLPDRAGLFTYPGAPAIPAAATVLPGLAGTISVNALMDSAQGGNPALLRDGGANGAAYVYNVDSSAAFTDRLQSLIDGMSTLRSFAPGTGAATSATLTGYANSSISWLQELRKGASTQLEVRTAVRDRAATALSSDTGVNLDEEMTKMLELERSYQASSRLITTIDSMLQTLLDAVR